MHIMYCCCRRRSMTAMTQSQSVHCESRLLLTRRTEFTNFDASFSAALDFRGFFSGTAVYFNTRLRCTAKHKCDPSVQNQSHVAENIN